MIIEKTTYGTQRANQRRSHAANYLRAAIFVSSLVLLLNCPAVAQTTDYLLGQGIGTVVKDAYGDGSNVKIKTSIEAVTYSNPVRVNRDGLKYFEVIGTIRGTGWGGEWSDLTGPSPVLSANAHYSYDVPFVLRWAHKWDGTLVYYGHGRVDLGLLALIDGAIGEKNEGRRMEEEGRFVSDAVLMPQRGYAFFAPNLNGLKREGTFSVTALEGQFAGQPLMAVVDVPIARDITQLAKLLLTRLAGKAVERTIGTGHSGGALAMEFINGGVSTNLDNGRTVFTGGNFVRPYKPNSGVIFDGVIPIAGASLPLHPQFPMAAPMMMVSGEADYSAVDSVRHASRLLRAGVDISSTLWLYQIRNLPHNFAEIVESTPNINRFLLEQFGVTSNADGDRMKPVMAAVIENMADLLKHGTAPPRSRFDGQGIDTNGDQSLDAISFTQANGQSTQLWPFVDDPAIDRFLGQQIPTTVPGLTARFLEVLKALEPEPGLAPPQTSCRLGGFELAIDARLLPFEDFFEHWKNKGQYRACVSQTINQLSRQRLYDRQADEENPQESH